MAENVYRLLKISIDSSKLIRYNKIYLRNVCGNCDFKATTLDSINKYKEYTSINAMKMPDMFVVIVILIQQHLIILTCIMNLFI